MGISVVKEAQLNEAGEKIDDIAVITKTTETIITERISRTQLISTRATLLAKAAPFMAEIEEIDLILGALDG